MIITHQDVEDFIEEYSDFQTEYRWADSYHVLDDLHNNEVQVFLQWINEHPQALIAGDFSEYLASGNRRLFPRSKVIYNTPMPFFRSKGGLWSVPGHIASKASEPWRAYSMNQVRQMDHLDAQDDDDSGFASDEILLNPEVLYPSANSIIDNLQALCDSPQLDPTLFVSPRLWTPSRQRTQMEALRDSAIPIIQELQRGDLELCALDWRQLEEIVAELLRRKGLDIHVVKENPQGGRDIVARGELVPGAELVTIAVEVKHRRYVDRPEVQKALHQNRMFPALMFVTSGRFSAGVLREATLPENRMRLFLKDGVAIRDLISTYGL